MNLLSTPLYFSLTAVLATGLMAQEAPDPAHLSPDGRFVFEAFSSEEVDAGKRPNFGIIERSGGKLVSDPEEELGDAFRPEETILWAPDSRAYALTTRVGTRHLATFLYRWDGKAFRQAVWKGDARMEAFADEHFEKAMRGQGFSAKARRGQTIAGDSLFERWLDPRRVIMVRREEASANEEGGEDGEGAVLVGECRAIVRWDEASASYVVERILPVIEAWDPEVEPDSRFEIEQSDVPGDHPTLRKIAVRDTETKQTRSFIADGWMTAPGILPEHNGWPQIELRSHGPDEFVWRKLYREEKGAYRCVRIDEMTRLVQQAPEGAPSVEISPGYVLYHLRTRHLKAGDADTFESFSVETPSPDRKWKALALYHPQYLQRVEIVDAAGAAEPVVLYDFDSGDGDLSTVCQVLWRPDSQAFAFYQSAGPRTGQTLLYRRSNRVWSKSPMPESDYGSLKLDGAAAKWQNKFEKPLWWNGSRELVLELSGFFTGDEGFDYRALATLNWDAKGKPAGTTTTPQVVGARSGVE